MQGFLTKQSTGGQIGMGDTSALGGAFLDLMTKMMSDPTAVANAQIDLFNDSMTVWRHAAERMFLMREKDAEPARDKRFKHPDWTENATFSFIR
jgi:polyhydroxyalkanoate synthase subunit PhaC